MVNGFGTWFWGQKNTHIVRGACEHCHGITDLKSYDTRLYIVALFLPIIPLGRRRVLFECPACQRFRSVKLDKWQEGAAEARANAYQALETAAPPEGAIEAINGLRFFQDGATFAELAPQFRAQHPADVSVAAALRDGHGFFHQLDEAEEIGRAILNLDGAFEHRGPLARILLRQGRPDDARALLMDAVRERVPEASGYLYLLVEALEAQGRHDDALEIIHQAQQTYPEVAADKAWNRLRKLAEKHRMSGKAVKPQVMGAPARTAKDRSSKWAVVLGPALVVALLLGYLWLCYSRGQNIEAYAVNGLNRQYQAVIDGEPQRVPPNRHIPIRLAEGPHTLAVPELGIDEFTFEVDTGFLLRPLREPIVVLNPDQVAIVCKETIHYTVAADEEVDEIPFETFANEVVYTFTGIHFPFQEFPAELEIVESKAKRRRLVLLSELGPAEIFAGLATNLSPDAALLNLTRRFHYDPEDLQCLSMLLQMMEPEAFLAEIGPEVAARPVFVDVHRIHQSLMDKLQPDHDLEAEYRGYLDAAPGDPALQYLLARVTEDTAAAKQLLRQAAAGPEPFAYAFYGLAYHELIFGRFAEAYDYAVKACELDPGQELFLYARDQALMALGRFDELLAGIERDKDGVPVEAAGACVEASLLIHKGLPEEEARAAFGRFLERERASGEWPEGAMDGLEKLGEARCAYARGDLERYHAIIGALSDAPDTKFCSAMAAGDLAAADEALNAAEETETKQHLLLYVAAAQAGEAGLSGSHLNAAVDLLRAGEREERFLAGCLAGEREAGVDRLLGLEMIPDDKRVALAALGTRFPADQARYFELARTLNYEVEVPHYILKGLLGDAGPAPEPAPDAASVDAAAESPAQPAQ
ncbi:MAG: tetratricopeptide repeat protein [Candidatus Hydrogenedentes bacterium]|nr:tetratricopeptide repeat protein [Candidatus Hydrogenedentota bacterium]